MIAVVFKKKEEMMMIMISLVVVQKKTNFQSIHLVRLKEKDINKVITKNHLSLKGKKCQNSDILLAKQHTYLIFQMNSFWVYSQRIVIKYSKISKKKKLLRTKPIYYHLYLMISRNMLILFNLIWDVKITNGL